LERLIRDKRSSLLFLVVSDEEKKLTALMSDLMLSMMMPAHSGQFLETCATFGLYPAAVTIVLKIKRQDFSNISDIFKM